MKKIHYAKYLIISLLVILIQFVFIPPHIAHAATTKVGLGTAGNFAVLGGSAINDTTPSVISGDVGLSPAAWAPAPELTCGEVTGTIYSVDSSGPLTCRVTNAGVLTTAKSDLTTAYNDAAARVVSSTIGTELGGVTLTDGVYDSASTTFEIVSGGTLTLDGGGSADSVFIFKMGTSLTTFSNSKVELINGAQACNVFWQVGSSAVLGSGTSFIGDILADQSITDNGGSSVTGRFLARISAVTLNNTTIAKSTCAAASSSSSSSSSSSTTSSTSTPVCIDTPPTNNPDLFQIDRSGSSATLYFTPVNDYLSYYYIAYGLSPGDEQFGVSFPSGLSSGVISYTINELNPNATYYFKVRGGNGCAPGGWSNSKESNSTHSNKSPMLPNAGNGPQQRTFPLQIPVGIFVAVTTLLILIQRKQRWYSHS